MHSQFQNLLLSSRFSQIIRKSSSTTIDIKEIKQFIPYVNDWWNEFGVMKPLHSMNKLRVPLVRDGLIEGYRLSTKEKSGIKVLQGLSILDVGCGGGILSEPLSRIGLNVTGLDANPDLIDVAKKHAAKNNLFINYINSSIEEHCSSAIEKYDAIVASEVIEHVTNKETFLTALLKCLKPGGSIFLTTLNQTLLAEICGIYFAENCLGIVPEGTHEIEKFIEPHKLQRMLEDLNCRTHLLHGMFYNFLTNSWTWTSNVSLNYAIHAFKLPS